MKGRNAIVSTTQEFRKSFHNFLFSGIRIYFLAFTIYFFPTFLMQTTFSNNTNSHVLRLISYLSIFLLLYKYLLSITGLKEN